MTIARSVWRALAEWRIPTLLLAVVAVAANGAQLPQVRLDVRVGAAPAPFIGGDGLTHLAYELDVTASGTGDARVNRVQVFGESDSEPLASYATSGELDDRVMSPDADPGARRGRLVRNGSTAVIYIWLTLPEGRPLPAHLRNTLDVTAGDGSPVPIRDLRIDVGRKAKLVLGPPLGSGLWFVHNGPGDHRSAHWGSALADHGRARIPQRFAIDFIGVDADGRAVRGDFRKSANEDWVGFGADVIAVGDGVVHAMRDGIADNAAMTEPGQPTSPSVEATYGNYVILALGGGTFAHYAHLQRGSVTVKSGDRIRRGQLLGRLGNSGNTNAPHLHFNVTDTTSPETSEGLPYAFDTFDWMGTTTAEQAVAGEPGPWRSQEPPATRTRALPLGGSVVRFPSSKF
jgi:murein DD-endopeptidase MepM/ murein hydrolase activator NlpD